MSYLKVQLRTLIQEFDEKRIKQILDSFSCPLNPDVEQFLQQNAILFDQQGLSRTTLVMADYRGEKKIAGYYA